MAVVVIGIVLIVVAVAAIAFVGYLFVWAARKDGEDNDAVHASSTPFRDALRRSPGRGTKGSR
jgi:nitrogen fixation-related uncharacterized protein